jgi:hypothetical protein
LPNCCCAVFCGYQEDAYLPEGDIEISRECFMGLHHSRWNESSSERGQDPFVNMVYGSTERAARHNNIPRQIVQFQHHQYSSGHTAQDIKDGQQQTLGCDDSIPNGLHLLFRLGRQIDHTRGTAKCGFFYGISTVIS